MIRYESKIELREIYILYSQLPFYLIVTNEMKIIERRF